MCVGGWRGGGGGSVTLTLCDSVCTSRGSTNGEMGAVSLPPSYLLLDIGATQPINVSRKTYFAKKQGEKNKLNLSGLDGIGSGFIDHPIPQKRVCGIMAKQLQRATEPPPLPPPNAKPLDRYGMLAWMSSAVVDAVDSLTCSLPASASAAASFSTACVRSRTAACWFVETKTGSLSSI